MARHRFIFGMLASLVLLGGTLLLAQQGVVRTKDGRTLTGDISEEEDGVIVNIRGVETLIDRASVESIAYDQDLEKEFRERLSKLDPKDVPGRIELSRWAFDNREYELAREAAIQATELDPNNADAAIMLDTIRGQMRLEGDRAEGGATDVDENTAPPAGDGAAQPPAGNRRPRIERNLLSADDINKIRQAELKSTDNVRVRFDNRVKQRFTAHRARDIARFNSMRPVDQALMILEQGEPEFREDVRILSDPASLMEYRRGVQTMALNGCASTGCHGGSNGGNFILFNPAEGDEGTYTNFYILQQYLMPAAEGNDGGGVFSRSGGERRMIDRVRPEQSLLAQFGLPADLAEFDHPEVAGYPRGMFRNREDPRYRQLIQWMGQSLAPVVPEYGIDFQPPTAADAAGGATEEPAATTEPATQPQ